MNRSKDFYYFSEVLKEHNRYIKGFATAAVLGFGLSLTACSDSTNTAGGGPSGTEAGNAITAQILAADKTPAASARVKVIKSESLDSENAYTAETDKNGNVSIEGVAKGDYILEAKQGGTALQMNVSVGDESVDLGAGNLEKVSSVNGTIAGNGEGTIKVRGLDYSAPVVDGKFQLDSLPAGHLDLVFIPKSADADTVSSYLLVDAGKTASAGTFANESNALLLDDFEDGNNQHRFGPMYFGPSEGGWWFLSRHDSVVVSSGLDSNGYLQMYNDGKDHLLHATFDFDTKDATQYYAWANIGVGIGSNDKSICYDLSSAEAISFKMKGTGSYYFNLEDEAHKPADAGNGSIVKHKDSKDFDPIPEDWTTVTINFADIIDETKGSLSCVTIMTWQFTNTTDVWIDDVELIGADRNSIWKTEPWKK